MKKPRFSDFGITKEFYDETKIKFGKLKEFLQVVYIIVTFLLAFSITIFLLKLKLKIEYAFGITLITFLIWLYLYLFSAKYVNSFVNYVLCCNYKYKTIKEYDLAIEEYNDWWIRSKKSFWLSLDGISFENELAKLFNNIGYNSEITKASGDEGIDIKLRDDHNRYLIVQCKAHKNPVGPATARELYGALIHSGADEAILASLSGFTMGTFNFIKNKPIRLISLDEIIDLQRKIE